MKEIEELMMMQSFLAQEARRMDFDIYMIWGKWQEGELCWGETGAHLWVCSF